MYRYLILIAWIGLSGWTAQAQVVRGVVSDADGDPLEGVHVRVQGGNLATVTSTDGQFRLSVPDAADERITLSVSRVGYMGRKIELSDEDLYGQERLLIRMKLAVYQSEAMVVTATRTRKDIEEVAVPVSVITGEEIRRSGSMRLSDVLQEQIGMQIVNDHGPGLQMQGFAPDYTLLMIDGVPVIGRTAGTLDLTRISVQNVDQIEVVKGPSSALWGSDALAGVVNIITHQSREPLAGNFATRYGTNQTTDVSGNLSVNVGSWHNNLFVNRNGSAGYRLSSASVSQTVPEYENYTIQYRSMLEMSDRAELDASVRYFRESQEDRVSVAVEEQQVETLHSDGVREDLTVTPRFRYGLADRMDVSASWANSFYKTESDLLFPDTGSLYESTHFHQFYHKPELQWEYGWTTRHRSVAGTGGVYEHLDSERYPSQPAFVTRFVFAQHSWMPSPDVELTGGVRHDVHSEYRSQWSPKLSFRYRQNSLWQFRLSAGRGFKAPEFRQLFLDFTNTSEGYSVFGASTVEEGIQRQQTAGEIAQLLVPLDQLNEIQAESSWAVNTGIDIDPVDRIRIRVNLFHNRVFDLIETAPIAQRTNGQSVFTYFNIDEVTSQGVETEIRFRMDDHLEGAAGYQFMDTRRRIERDRTVQNEQGDVVTVSETTFESMFNRSRHSGTVRLFYENGRGWGGTIRATLRGRYGLFDRNGNGFVDSSEYESGYAVWNLSVSRVLFDRMTLKTGVENLFDYRNVNQAHLPGRRWYGSLSIRF